MVTRMEKSCHSRSSQSSSPDSSRHRSSSSRSKRSRDSAFYDEDGNYIAQVGEALCSGRYEVLSFLGQGAFGSVIHCRDRKRHRDCAVKVIRDNKKYVEDAEYEIDILDDIFDQDQDRMSRCVELWNVFSLGRQVCMVFEPLGKSIYDVLKQNRHMPFPIPVVVTVAHQVLECLAFLSRMKLVHTDLKPENILFEDSRSVKQMVQGKSITLPERYDIKVIDFGNATYVQEISSSKVCTRHYRPPEVILDADWSMPCDMWSLGCILVEMLTGEMLFDMHNSLEHLAMIEKVIGPFPDSLLRRARSKRIRHFVDGSFDWLDRTPPHGAVENIEKTLSLQRTLDGVPQELVDLISRMLTIEPSLRVTPEAALAHRLFGTPNFHEN